METLYLGNSHIVSRYFTLQNTDVSARLEFEEKAFAIVDHVIYIVGDFLLLSKRQLYFYFILSLVEYRVKYKALSTME